jgi:hypothetical protein
LWLVPFPFPRFIILKVSIIILIIYLHISPPLFVFFLFFSTLTSALLIETTLRVGGQK